jgi:hypothetical protein
VLDLLRMAVATLARRVINPQAWVIGMKTDPKYTQKAESWREQDGGCMVAILCIVVVLALVLFALDSLLSAGPH